MTRSIFTAAVAAATLLVGASPLGLAGERSPRPSRYAGAEKSSSDSKSSTSRKIGTAKSAASKAGASKPSINLPSTSSGAGKQKRPSGQNLAKEFKENIKKTGSLSGKHHPAVEAALKSAAARKKQLLVIFMTRTCKICLKMEKEALGQKDFSNRFLKDYAILRVDCDKNPEIADHYLFTPLIPHLKVLDAKGRIVKETTGYESDTKFADWLATK